MRTTSLADMKTSTRVVVGAGLVTLLLVGLMALAITRLNGLTRDIDGMASARVPKITLSGRAIETLLQTARQMRNTLIFDDENEIHSEIADIGRNEVMLGEVMGQLEKLSSGDTEGNLLKAMAEARAQYEPLEREFIEKVKKGDYSSAKDLMISRVRQVQIKYVDAVSAFIEFQNSAIESEAKAAHDTQQRTVLIMLALTAVAVVVAMLATYAITRGIRSRFGESSYAARIARGIAEGDLTQGVEVGRGDDQAILAAMQRMRDDLVNAVAAIRGSAQEVGTAARQIAAGNSDLSSRTEEQASSLEETAASMEELASTVKQNAENAVQADQLAHNASQRAEQGGHEVGEVVSMMGEISQSASRIGDIISVIDGIAFQTNILALNAAVEAARAGEQGRGFAVVASEVRSLAHRSAEAAKEIKSLIGTSTERVEKGKRLVEKAGGTIEALVADVKHVGEIMRSIAEASAEQSRGVTQVNKTITEMDKVVQQNASAVQESATAAEAMRNQAEVLLAAVSAFRLDAAEEVHPAAPAHPAQEPQPQPRPRKDPLAAIKGTAALALGTGAGALSDDDWEQF